MRHETVVNESGYKTTRLVVENMKDLENNAKAVFAAIDSMDTDDEKFVSLTLVVVQKP